MYILIYWMQYCMIVLQICIYHGKLGKGYVESLCSTFYNCMWIYSYPQIQILIKKIDNSGRTQWLMPVTQCFGRLSWEDSLRPGVLGCSELWLCHWTIAWVTEQEPLLKKKTTLLSPFCKVGNQLRCGFAQEH